MDQPSLPWLRGADFLWSRLQKGVKVSKDGVSLDRDDDVFFEHAIVGDTLDKDELRASVKAVLSVADHYDDEIQRRWGGRKALEPEQKGDGGTTGFVFSVLGVQLGTMRTAAAMTAPTYLRQVEKTARSESELLDALAAGERSAAAELMERTYQGVWATLYRLSGGDSELAADLTQETFRRAWSAMAGFDRRSRLSTWLFRIAYNTFLNHVRRPHLVQPLEPGQAERTSDPEPSQEEALLGQERAERLRRAVLDLPDVLRSTVTARYWGDLPAAEIANLHGISQVTVRKRLRKALAVLAESLEVLS